MLNRLASTLLLFGLVQSVLLAQFTVNGIAFQESAQCWSLTTELNSRVGSIWTEKKINLNESFEVSVKVFLGCKDELGADGIVFALQPVSTSAGQLGSGLGIEGVAPSLGIEMDTWQNFENGDPPFDHLSIIRNGDVNHKNNNTLVGPKAFGNGVNVEDCTYHDLHIVWDGLLKKLEVYWDCVLTMTYQGDLVRDIFMGNPEVYWGFTASTGGAHNEQKVCLKSVKSGGIPFKVKLGKDSTLCEGQGLDINPNISGATYRWQDNSTASVYQVTKAGDYFVTVDKEACYASDTLSIRYLSKPVATLGTDTSLCFGQKITLRAKVEQGTYAWSNGSILDSTTVSQAATYEVTLRNRCGTASDDIRVDYESCREAFIPNAFSPNGDQQNEVWSIQSGRDVKLVHRLEIYNRWGSRVFQALNFQANDLNSAWTGEGFPEGVYLYLAEIEYRDGGVEIKKGSLSLLR